MTYGIRELADLAGVSARTLRYYDTIGLLKPMKIGENGYRYYGEKEVDLLWQILYYRERGFELRQIQKIVYQENFDILGALEEHLTDLEAERKHVDFLIRTVKQTIMSMKGECKMSDEEKFAAFKGRIVDENEKKYGAEIREKYGDDMVDAVNNKILNMSQADYEKFKALEEKIRELLKAGVCTGISPDSEAAGEIVKLHKEWLCMTWKTYTPEAHRALADMYMADERFKMYYDETVPGCANLLSKAIHYWAVG